MKKQTLIIGIVLIGIIILVILVTMGKSEPTTNPTLTPTNPQPTSEQVGSKRDPELVKRVENFQRQNHPDVFLKNKLTNEPYETTQFSITSDFVKATPSGHFHFTISLKDDKTSAKNGFITWLQSLGLTSQQITTLDVTYK